MTASATPPTALQLLAVLWAVEHVLAAARVAIEAANPELLVERPIDFPPSESLPRIWAAQDIARLAADLANAIARYRHAVSVADVATPDLPF